MATQVTVITGEGSTTYSVSTGARGPTGPAGPASSSSIGWFDSYDHYADGTTITHLSTTPLVGDVYRQSKTGSAAANLSVTDGALVGINNSLNYIGSSVATDGTNLDMTFEMSLTANATPMAVAGIMPNISFNSKKIIGDDGGIGGIDGTLIHLNFDAAGVIGTSYNAAEMTRLSPTDDWIAGMNISPNVRFQIRIQVSSDVMRVTAFGRTIVYKDSRINDAVGPTVYWWFEFAGNTLGSSDTKATTRLHRMWAEAPILNDIYPDPQGLAATINSGSNLTYPANLRVLNNASGFDNGSPPDSAFLAGVGDLFVSGRKARNHFFFTTPTVIAGSFVVGQAYIIASVGTTSFTAIGAADNNIGTVFTATGVGAGTGTATTTNAGLNTTITLASRTYTFVTSLSGQNQVLIGATNAVTMTNLAAAINDVDNAGEGTLYGTGTAAHATVSAVAYPNGIEIIARNTGITQNSYICSDNLTNGGWLFGTMTGGSRGVATMRPFGTLASLPLTACNYALPTTVVSAASASNQTLTSVDFYPWIDVGTVEKFEFFGTFGANTHEKTVRCFWLGSTQFTSGPLTENETTWSLTIFRHKETSISHRLTFLFQTDAFRKSGKVDFNYGELYSTIAIQALTTTAGDVTLRTGVGTLFMKP